MSNSLEAWSGTYREHTRRNQGEFAPSLNEVRSVRAAKKRPVSSLARGQREIALDIAQHGLEAGLEGLAGGVDHQLGCGGRLVRGGDAGEVADLAGAGPAVEALRIALLAGGERCAQVDLVK